MARWTVAAPAALEIPGPEAGRVTRVRLAPAPAGSGLLLRRADLSGAGPVVVLPGAVQATEAHLQVGGDGWAIEGVEVLLAAVYARGVHDLVIEVDGPRVPCGSGSLQPWLDLLDRAAPVAREGVSPECRVTTPFQVTEGEATYLVAPGEGLRLTTTIRETPPATGWRTASVDLSADSLGVERLGARETTDLLGALALVGGTVHAHVVATQPNHRGNLALATAIRRRAQAPAQIDITRILRALPHRYPFLLVDRIVETNGSDRIVGIKNVTINEPFFQGHFPGHPIMPGVLIVEAMAQTGGMLLMDTLEHPEEKVVYFMALDAVKFRRPVGPGDQVRFEITVLQNRGKTWRMRGEAYVAGQLVCEAEMMARLVDR